MKLNAIKISLFAISSIVLFNACKKDPYVADTYASITTTAISSITASSAISGGNISSDGGGDIRKRGVCYSTVAYPSLTNSKFTSDGNTVGAFTSTLPDLTPGTQYFVRAYATNYIGTNYGDQLRFTTPRVEVGDNFDGGIVGYLLRQGDDGYSADSEHGMVVSTSDLTPAIWGEYSVTGASQHGLGDGMANTLAISNNLGDGTYAANFCLTLAQNTYNKWYLPSIDELGSIYQNRDIIGNFGSANYWSSSEFDASSAFVFDFGAGSFYGSDKSEVGSVRAIRYF